MTRSEHILYLLERQNKRKRFKRGEIRAELIIIVFAMLLSIMAVLTIPC